jgi:hydrogenase nickel incorporation protein HypA/HybF
MHELSIVEALRGQVEKEVERAGEGGRVTRLSLIIGRLSGVNSDSIRFAFELLAPGTVLEKAQLVISEPRAECVCEDCGATSEIDRLVAQCPTCASHDITIRGGTELILQTIDLE